MWSADDACVGAGCRREEENEWNFGCLHRACMNEGMNVVVGMKKRFIIAGIPGVDADGLGKSGIVVAR